MENAFGSADPITVVAMACLVLLSLAERLIHTFGFRQREGANREWQSSVWIVVSFGVVASYSALDAIQFQWPTLGLIPVTLRIVGLIVLAAGCLLRIVMRVSLGRQFSVFVQTSANHRLVTTGIYRYVRHPAYSGTLLMYLGFPLALGSVGGFGLAIALGVPALIYRIRVEERALLQWFGEDYAEYRNRTWRLIPRVW